MQYLETHETIRNKKAREITFIKDADHMKRILQRMADTKSIVKEGVGGGQVYRKVGKATQKVLASRGEEKENDSDTSNR